MYSELLKQYPDLWTRVLRVDGAYNVCIMETRSPLAKVILQQPCTSKTQAEKMQAQIMKELGKTYGGRR